MKVPISWLKDLVDIPCGIEELCESLSMSGFEVEELVDQSQLLSGIVVGYVLDVTPHPNADKLKVCKVDIGKTNTLQIVCGAKNVRPNIHVLVATQGAYLKSIDLNIKSSKLRGVQSEGMICSLDELGIGCSSDGIAIIEEMNLPPVSTEAKPHKLLGLDETIIDLAITANRPDGMSMVGIAREVSAIKQSSLNLPCITNCHDYKLFNPTINDDEILHEDGIYSLHEIEALDGKIESTEIIKSRLENSGIKPINLIVDITNYVMLEQGQPLHAFDADLLDNISKHKVKADDFGLRNAKDGEEFVALDGKKYILSKNVDVVTCNNNIIAIAGVIGGVNSAVNSNTKRVWLEAALFKPSSVRNSSRALGIRTDSSSRFEKGISPQITKIGAARAIELYMNSTDCSVKEKYINHEQKIDKTLISLKRDKINRILGQIKDEKINNDKQSENKDINKASYQLRNLTDFEIEEKLELLGCEIEKKEYGWDIQAPLNRTSDLIREIDYIEEIARLTGYDRFDSNLPDPIKPGGLKPGQVIERRIRSSLAASGLQEITTFSLVGDDDQDTAKIKISNPLLSETSVLRTNLWNEHINICKRNIDSGQKGCWVFEIGKKYLLKDNKIIEETVISGAILGSRKLGKWHSSNNYENLDYYEARGLLQSAFLNLNINVKDKKNTNAEFLHPGKSAQLILEGRPLGLFGQLHPREAQKRDIIDPLYIFEIQMNQIIEAATRKNNWNITFKNYPTVPSMQRDIAFITSKQLESIQFVNSIEKAGKPLVENVELIDRYYGNNIDEGNVSLTFRITYRKRKETLKESEIAPVHSSIISMLVKKFNVMIRD